MSSLWWCLHRHSQCPFLLHPSLRDSARNLSPRPQCHLVIEQQRFLLAIDHPAPTASAETNRTHFLSHLRQSANGNVQEYIRDIRRTLQLQEPRHQTAPSHQANQVCAVDDLAISTNDKALEPHCAMNNHLTCTWKTTQNYASFSQRRPSSS